MKCELLDLRLGTAFQKKSRPEGGIKAYFSPPFHARIASAAADSNLVTAPRISRNSTPPITSADSTARVVLRKEDTNKDAAFRKAIVVMIKIVRDFLCGAAVAPFLSRTEQARLGRATNSPGFFRA